MTTIITPSREDFPHERYISPNEVETIYDDFTAKLDYTWDGIVALVFSTPKSLSETLENFEELWNKFISNYMSRFYASKILELWEEELRQEKYLEDCSEEERKEYSLTLKWDYFPYGDCPDFGVCESKNSIKSIKSRLVGMCSSTPKDLIRGYNIDIERILSSSVNNLRTLLENTLQEYFFSLLCVKYKDTIKLC